MNRLFWRHAEAGFAHEDLARPLTARGVQQAERTAAWLRAQGVDFPVFASQALRGQQTAACYGKPQILAGLNPDNGFAPVWQALDALAAEDAVIVGHMPWIAAAIARVLGDVPPMVGYSELFWLSDAQGQWKLQAHFAGAAAIGR